MTEKITVCINRLQHTGIPVTDIQRSEAFYAGLGFSNVMQASFMLDGKNGVCIMMQLKDAIIELYQLPDHKLDEIRERKDGHIDHIAFDTDDADAAFLLLKNAGYAIVEEAPVFLSFWAKGCKYFNILGPDGERVEFNEIIK